MSNCEKKTFNSLSSLLGDGLLGTIDKFFDEQRTFVRVGLMLLVAMCDVGPFGQARDFTTQRFVTDVAVTKILLRQPFHVIF